MKDNSQSDYTILIPAMQIERIIHDYMNGRYTMPFKRLRKPPKQDHNLYRYTISMMNCESLTVWFKPQLFGSPYGGYFYTKAKTIYANPEDRYYQYIYPEIMKKMKVIHPDSNNYLQLDKPDDDIIHMFDYVNKEEWGKALTDLDTWDISKVTDMSHMFDHIDEEDLKKRWGWKPDIEFDKFSTTEVPDYSKMFKDCHPHTEDINKIIHGDRD